ncbi:MAG: exosortase/archaeosortase family protein [Chthoniobacteraceae bacterium]
MQAALLAGSFATLVWFFFFVHIWVNGEQTTLKWAMNAWNHKSGEQYHGRFVPLVSIFLIWLRRDRYLAAPKSPSNWGLLWIAFGVISFVIGARCLQPRFALVAIPFLFYGASLFLWGRHVARLALFPCVFLIFMIPLASLEQATADLQFVITGAIGVMANLIGITVQVIGTTLTARDGSFNFEIAEGCSGVRSLSAMSMLTAVYVHLTQDRLWKKVFIFGASLLFAIFGNVGRLFTILVFAKYISPEIAGGLYHDYSGFLFFPIAVLAMTGFSRLVNLDWKKIFARWTTNEPPRPGDFTTEESKPATKPPGGPISYDY